MKVLIGPYPKGKSKAKRKISVRIDKWDTWSLDHTLAHIIAPALKQMRRSKQGIPGGVFDYSHHDTMKLGTPEHRKAEKKSHRDGIKKWEAIMDQMIWSFEEVRRDSPNEPDITKDKKAYFAYQARVSDGFKTFGEWYQALWT